MYHRVLYWDPSLFLLHINDLPSVITSQVRLFADECLMYHPICSVTGHLSEGSFVRNVVVQIPKFDNPNPKSNPNPSPDPNPNPNSNPSPNPNPNPMPIRFRQMTLRTSELLPICSSADCEALQRDLNSLEQWSNTWGMKFNTKQETRLSLTNGTTHWCRICRCNGVADLLKTHPPHMCYQAEFGCSAV